MYYLCKEGRLANDKTVYAPPLYAPKINNVHAEKDKTN